MSKVNDQKNRVLGYISALRTMLDNYPELKTSDTLERLLNSNSPLGFLLNLVEICGISQEDLLNWVAKILCGAETMVGTTLQASATSMGDSSDEKTGVLDIIEEAVKIILLTNVKNLFTCSLNPLIPKDVMTYPYDDNYQDGKGIQITIPTIDMFNVLSFPPTSLGGRSMYFDNNYSPNELWKSLDFNAFLWYIINKSSNISPEKRKCIWDNRVRRRKELKRNEVFKKNFFNTDFKEGCYISTNDSGTTKCSTTKTSNSLKKNQYLYIEYEERNSTTAVPDVLRIYLSEDRYFKNNKIPRTVFEFDFDYIYSLKLFNSKTVVAHVINAILGVTNSAFASLMNGKYSLQQQIIAGKISEITKKMMRAEDTVIDDCFFSFSNKDYDTLLQNAELKYKNRYKIGNKEGELSQDQLNEIYKNLDDLGNSASLSEQQTKIANIFTQVSATAAQNGMISEKDRFTFGESIIFDLIEQTVTQIVLQVLSPKVMVLYALNSYFMGDAADGDFSKINVENLLKGLINLIQSLVKQVLEIILQELLKFLLEEVMDLVLLMIEKLLLERIRYYIELLRRLLALLDMFSRANKKKADTIIDNVNYADIVPEQTKPNDNLNKC